MTNTPRFLLRVFVSMALVAVILYVVPLPVILRSAVNASFPMVALALCATTGMVLIGGFFASELTEIQGHKISSLRFAHISFTTTFYGIFLPGALSGGLIRWHKINQVRKGKAQNATTVAMGRLISLLVASVFGVCCWALDRQAGLAEGIVLIVACLGLSSIYSLVLYSPASGWLERRFEGRLMRWPGLGAAMLRLLGSFSELYGTPGHRVARLLGISLVYHLCGLLAYCLFSAALDLEVGPLTLGWIRSYVIIATLLPISFAGIGVREGLLTVLMPAYGVPPSNAVALGLLLLLGNLFNALIGSILEARHAVGKRSTTPMAPR